MIQDENRIKLGGIFLPGLIKSMEIKSSAKIEEQEVEGSAVKPKQATGYEDVKINIELFLDDDIAGQSKEDKLKIIKELYRKAGQKVPQPISIIEPYLGTIGVHTVLFKNYSYRLSNKKEYIMLSIELWEYIPMSLPVRKKKSNKTAADEKIRLKESYQEYLDKKSGKETKLKFSPIGENKVDFNYKMKIEDYYNTIQQLPMQKVISKKPKFEGSYEIR